MHPWDAAHRALDDASFLESPVRPSYAEPDLVQAFPFRRGRDPELEDRADVCRVDAMNPEWPPQQSQFGWHLADTHSQLKSARDHVGDPGADRIRIAILDTGYDPGHGTRPLHLARALERNFVDEGRPWDATDPARHFPGFNPGHGTATLALLAGNRVRPPLVSGTFHDFLGGAPYAEVVPIRIADSVIHFCSSSMVQGIEYAARIGAQVVSISMGGVPAKAWARAVNDAYEVGVTIVAAAGNNFAGFPTRSLVYPARFHRVIAVCGATARKEPYYRKGHLGMQGNFGPEGKMETALAAYTPNTPWAEIGCGDVIDLDGSGTSAATPQVAAAAALWLQHAAPDLPQPWQRVEAVRKALFDSAEKTRPDGTRYFGRGLLRARRALDEPVHSDLPKEARDRVSFPWIRMLLDLEAPISEGKWEMYQVEALQLFYSSPRLQELVGEADPDEDELSIAEQKRLVSELMRHPAASHSLRRALEDAHDTL
jgi:hypothetical protein